MKFKIFSDIQLEPRRSSPQYIRGGIQRPSQLPPKLRFRRGNKIWDRDIEPSADPTFLEGTYIFGGFVPNHFGHMISEECHSFWLLEKFQQENTPFLFVARKNSREIPQYFLDLLALFDIKNFIIVHEPTVVEKLIIGEQGKQVGNRSPKAYLDFLERRLSHLRGSPIHKKLAILRPHRLKGQLVGESSLEKLLESQGYFIFRPEDYSLEDQLRITLNAEKVVYSEGSAIHLWDILPISSRCQVYVINRRPYSRLARNSLRDKVGQYHVYKRSTPIMGSPRGSWRSDAALFYVDLHEVVADMANHGFITETHGFHPDYYNTVSKYI